MPLTSDTYLEVADGVEILRNNAEFHLSLGRHRLRGGRYTLAIIGAFSTPRSMKSGLEELKNRIKGVPAWVEIIAQIKGLYEYGILVEPGGTKVSRRAHEKRFDSAPIHITMLNDEARTRAFQSVIRQTVKRADVVLDIGTGTGILAVTAAMAGARQVYALEATAMSRAAQRLVDANGVSERVTVIEAHSYDIDLPEKATVLVSEVIGDDPLDEQILPTFADARSRLLVEDATIIPWRLRIYALPLEVPAEHLHRFRFTELGAAVWRERYGLDFGGLVLASQEQDHRVHLNSYRTRGWKRLAEAVVVEDVDLRRSEPQPISREVVFRATVGGSISGILVYFKADLGADIELSLHPDDATPSNSWGNLLHLLAEPLNVAAGEDMRLRYRYGEQGSRIELRRARSPLFGRSG